MGLSTELNFMLRPRALIVTDSWKRKSRRVRITYRVSRAYGMEEKEKIKQIPKILKWNLRQGGKIKEFLQVKIFSHATCDAVTKLQVRSVWKRDIKIFPYKKGQV